MKKNILVIGGAGFIGSNVCNFYLKNGYKVTILDNFSRIGTKDNVNWLKTQYKSNLNVIKADIIKHLSKLNSAVKNRDIIFHFAGQVAVTTSVLKPKEDFLINALGTINILEAIRLNNPDAILLFSSTNKVYGDLEDIKVQKKNNQYNFVGFPNGISEDRILNFHSPYGCSKGTADQYIRDYSRIYSLKTIVFRQSCIYGYRQFGIEDQGWVAWFVIASLFNKKITIYGDGKQIRDVLFIDDLIKAYDMAVNNPKTYGQIYNIGGGPEYLLSLLELIALLEKFFNKKINYHFSDWRLGDQRIYISDIRKAKKEFGWSPKISVQEGVEKLSTWVNENKNLFKNYF